AAGPRQLQRKAQRAQWRGESRRTRTQLQLEPWGRRRDRRSRERETARPAETQPARHAVVVAWCADVARRRRIRAHAEWQQQRVLPGQRNFLAELGKHSAGRRGAARVRALPSAFAAAAQGVLAAAILPR